MLFKLHADIEMSMDNLKNTVLFAERDFRRPQNLKTFDEKGEFLVMIKKESIVYPFVYATHPFDAIGWDGYCYPYILYS